MKIQRAVLIALIGIAQSAPAQDHLIPDTDVLVCPDSYLMKVRDVFARAFDDGVTSRAVVLPSFEVEYAIGLRKTKEGIEAFALKASSSIWDVQLLKEYEEGKVQEVSQDGRTVPYEKSEGYRKLKKSTPSDHRKIKTELRTRPIPKDLAEKINVFWREMLLNVEHPAKMDEGLDGVTYHFSAWVLGRGDLSGHVWSPEPDSKTGRLVALTEALADYASGKADLKRLTEQVERAGRRI